MNINVAFCSMDLKTSYMKFSKLPMDMNHAHQLTEIPLFDFISFYEKAYIGQVPGNIKRIAAEAAYLLAITFQCKNPGKTACDMLKNPPDVADAIWCGWNEMKTVEIQKMVDKIAWDLEERFLRQRTY